MGFRDRALVKAQHGEDALAQGGYFRTFEIDLAIDRHEQLDRLELGVSGEKDPALMHKLVGEVLDGVAKNLEGMAGLGAIAGGG